MKTAQYIETLNSYKLRYLCFFLIFNLVTTPVDFECAVEVLGTYHEQIPTMGDLFSSYELLSTSYSADFFVIYHTGKYFAAFIFDIVGGRSKKIPSSRICSRTLVLVSGTLAASCI